MASLPPAFTSLVTPLTLRLRDIVSFQLPRLSASSSGSGKRSQGSLSAINLASHEQELNDALQECNGLLQKLQLVHEELVDDLELQGNGLDNVLTAELQRLTKQYADARTSARQTILAARKAHTEMKKSGLDRDIIQDDEQDEVQGIKGTAAAAAAAAAQDLSRPSRSANPRRGGTRQSAAANGGDDAAQHASANLTAALESTLSRMSDSLTQSSYSAQLLEESSNTLETLSLDYTTFADLLRNSGGILKSMERADRIDALMLLGAYAFFVICVGYILKVRIWDRGVGVLMILLRIFGLRSGSTNGASIAAAAATTTTAAAAATTSRSVAASISSALRDSKSVIAQAGRAATASLSISQPADLSENNVIQQADKQQQPNADNPSFDTGDQTPDRSLFSEAPAPSHQPIQQAVDDIVYETAQTTGHHDEL